MSNMYIPEQNEEILIDDLVALNQVTNEIHKATEKDKDRVIGVCAEIYPNNEILVCDCGIIYVNVTGIVCLGDHLTVSDVSGKAQAIPEIQEEELFDVRRIGKVVDLGDVYSKAKVLLNIK